MTPWVKNPSAAARLLRRCGFLSSARCSGLEDLVLPQLWVASVAQIQSLAQERPYAAGVAIKLKKKKWYLRGC